MRASLLLLSALITPVAVHAEPPATRAAGVTVRLNEDGRFAPGDRVRVEVRPSSDGHLLVLHADPAGRVRVLFPLSPEDDAYVRGGRLYQLRDRANERDLFRAVPGSSDGLILAAVAEEPFDAREYGTRDHWNLEQLAPSRAGSDPEGTLLDIVRKVAGEEFDYGVASYVVSEQRYVAAGGWGPGWAGYGWGPGWGVSPWLWGAGFGWGGWGWNSWGPGWGWGGGWGWGRPVIVNPGNASRDNGRVWRGGGGSSVGPRIGRPSGGAARGGGGGGGGGSRGSGRSWSR